MTNQLTVVVLAAGGGTRMKSSTPKVLHHLAGRSMVSHVLTAVVGLEPTQVVAVIGHQRELVGPHISEDFPHAILAVQEEQLGTGHAVAIGLAGLPDTADLTGTVLVAYGDTPLLSTATLSALIADHEAADRAITVLTGVVDDPTGYGRIVRAADGGVRSIVEQKDASAEEQAITEVNSGIYAFSAAFLSAAVGRIGNENASGEFYLTDAVGLAVGDGLAVGAVVVADTLEIEGVNDRVQLAALGRAFNDRILTGWMRAGVTIVDPATTWIDADVELAPDVTLLPGVQLHGATSIETGATIGPDCTLRDTEVGAGASVVRTQALLAVIGEDATVGPFTYLRPGTVLGERGKIGGFVETKNAVIGAGSKVPHLSYVGDAEIGEGTNIGAGTIFANYDGVNKHRTVVGSHVTSGSNVTLVAPVTIGDGAATGAGTVVREDVAPGGLALSAGPQRVVEKWAQSRRPGTAQADAADAAGDR